jgi:hypothetical protein
VNFITNFKTKKRPRHAAGGREEGRLDDCTVSAMVVFLVKLSEVAAMVTICKPAGLPGVGV